MLSSIIAIVLLCTLVVLGQNGDVYCTTPLGRYNPMRDGYIEINNGDTTLEEYLLYNRVEKFTRLHYLYAPELTVYDVVRIIELQVSLREGNITGIEFSVLLDELMDYFWDNRSLTIVPPVTADEAANISRVEIIKTVEDFLGFEYPIETLLGNYC